MRTLSNVRTSAHRPRTIILGRVLKPLCANPFHCTRIISFTRTPSGFFLLIFRDSRGPFFPQADLLFHERTFGYCLRSVHANSILSNMRIFAHRERIFCLLCADLFPSHADRFHSSGPRVDFSTPPGAVEGADSTPPDFRAAVIVTAGNVPAPIPKHRASEKAKS